MPNNCRSYAVLELEAISCYLCWSVCDGVGLLDA